MDPDPDPRAPKTRGSGGSGSATLLDTVVDKSLRLRAFEEHFLNSLGS